VCALHRTANQLEAELVDLVDCMAIATKRNIKWVGGRIAQTPMSYWWTRYSKRSAPGGQSAWGGIQLTGRVSSNPATATSLTRQDSVYIIHELGAQPNALKLREEIMRQTQTKLCYVGTIVSPDDMDLCLERVAGSSYVILLQTRSVLTHAWPLLATYHASLAGVPLVCVVVFGGGYDFGSVKHHVTDLDTRLDAATLEQMSSTLAGWTPPRSVAALQVKLFSLIPQIISVVYHPSGSRNQLAATIHDIDDKQRLLQAQHRRQSTHGMRCEMEEFSRASLSVELLAA
jgi:hypothetical protein